MATIVMGSTLVMQACNTTIERILTEREKRDENAIRRVMLSTRVGAWFKRYNPTREQAIKILDEKMEYFGWRSQMGCGDLAHAKKLLTLAKHGDPVTLNEEDTRVLFG